MGESYLEERWSDPDVVLVRSKRFKMSPAQVEQVKLADVYPPSSEDANWEFSDAVRFTFHLQKLYLQDRPNAGFVAGDVNYYKGVLSKYDTGSGLHTRELFDPLGELGFTFTTLLEQNFLIDLVKAVDLDKSGTIDFDEFLHMMRTLYDRNYVSQRKREYSLVVRSGMALTECEDWFGLYKVVQSGSESSKGISLSDLRDLLERIDLTWTYKENLRLTRWLRECDEDSNGMIDFGEFCCLVKKMWDTNFANIMEKTTAANTAAMTRRKTHRRPSSMDPNKTIPCTWTAQLLADAHREALVLYPIEAETEINPEDEEDDQPVRSWLPDSDSETDEDED